MKYKALICDVDGTFVVNKRDAIPRETVISAVEKAKRNVKVCLATGRSMEQLGEIIQLAKITDLCIINGGSQVINPQSEEILWEQPLSLADRSQIIDIAQALEIEELLFEPDGKIADKSDKKVLQLDAMGITQEKADEFTSAVKHISDIAVHPVPSWANGRIDVLISHAFATKQHGVFELAKLLKIDTHEIIGVGDGGNDMPLLMACGLKIAMGNASDSLKAIADYIAPSVDDDGVAHVIEKFILS